MKVEPTSACMNRVSNPVPMFNAWFSVLVFLLNATAIWLSWEDKSWGALYIAIIACPVANLILMLLGTLAALIVKKLNTHAKLVQMLPVVVGLPLFGAAATLVTTFTLELHGC